MILSDKLRGPLRLGVNIDHVATIRNARGGIHPDPVRAAHLAEAAGADGITAHLREDRRHISDDDIARLRQELDKPLNLEMAASAEMLAIAMRHVPHAACLVPERRQELTTEGGLDVAGQEVHLTEFVKPATEFNPQFFYVCLYISFPVGYFKAASEINKVQVFKIFCCFKENLRGIQENPDVQDIAPRMHMNPIDFHPCEFHNSQ